jgi:hypothetical protein
MVLYIDGHELKFLSSQFLIISTTNVTDYLIMTTTIAIIFSSSCSTYGSTAQGGPWPPSRVSAIPHGCEQSFSSFYIQFLLHLLPPDLPILT